MTERRRLSLRARLGIIFGVALSAAAVVVIAVIGPYVRDDYALDNIVRAAAIEWREFGEDRARQRLLFELDKQKIGGQVADDDCVLDAKALEVRCSWSADLRLPGTSVVMPLSFSSRAPLED